MPIIEKEIEPGDAPLEHVSIEVDRHSLQKCRWRRAADDGVEFAFSLESPLVNGAVVLETASKRYEIAQLPELIYAINLPGHPMDAARLGWTLGNLHQPVEIRDESLLVAEDPAVKRLLEDQGTDYVEQYEIFAPPPHSAAHSHQHLVGFEYDHQHTLFGHSHAPSL